MKDFEEIIKPVMKWLAENKNPHTTIIVNATTAEIVEGTKGFNTDEFITD